MIKHSFKMVRTLYLIRHGEAEESVPGLKDFDRQLTPLGQRNASRMGKLMSDYDITPDLMVSSTASRASATAELISEQIKLSANKLEYLDDLYGASVRSLFSYVSNLHVEYKTVAIVGHNPVLIYLGEYLTKKAIGKLVPCGILQIGFDLNGWSEVAEGNGMLMNYYAPETFTDE